MTDVYVLDLVLSRRNRCTDELLALRINLIMEFGQPAISLNVSFSGHACGMISMSLFVTAVLVGQLGSMLLILYAYLAT